ncbi:hypothetical protein C9F11_42525 [Streptomyces sp. YIM 121038]|nr:hypothetical protein C9F11_00155 [Streptomyces sp. YIM 121038]QCX82085.1 hypothetical protein C9F11_42525 [Streptomyces sp. YIM 121038]
MVTVLGSVLYAPKRGREDTAEHPEPLSGRIIDADRGTLALWWGSPGSHNRCLPACSWRGPPRCSRALPSVVWAPGGHALLQRIRRGLPGRRAAGIGGAGGAGTTRARAGRTQGLAEVGGGPPGASRGPGRCRVARTQPTAGLNLPGLAFSAGRPVPQALPPRAPGDDESLRLLLAVPARLRYRPGDSSRDGLRRAASDRTGYLYRDDGGPAFNGDGALTALATRPSPGCNSLLKPDICTAVPPYTDWINDDR